ncbi:hypothetical protein DPMN_061943 [Dreissena polymorpha]|uniref:Uncharacterized protein n=1 Tax=Dreissena polymorpha TaxID=45954 RepID=A0A9D4C7X8_DREPO|nr:hypothetical protein DPMN_061943 [Dreissena polymorpha]
MPRKNVDSYSPGKIKNRFPRNRCVKFLDSPPPRYRSEAPVCSGIFVVVTCPLLPFFCSKRCCCRRLVVGRQCCRMGASVAVWALRVLSSNNTFGFLNILYL